jgi:hypothetical protein
VYLVMLLVQKLNLLASLEANDRTLVIDFCIPAII